MNLICITITCKVIDDEDVCNIIIYGNSLYETDSVHILTLILTGLQEI
jgi:hypothetical protein